MRSSFGALNTANMALVAQQVAVDTTSHNIANANTPGFTRQNAVLETTDPFTVPAFNRSPAAGQIGTGAQAATIRRLRDAFVDGQIRQQTGSLGEQQAMKDVMEQIEVVVNEPSDAGINSMMSRFFNAWQAVTNKPDDRAIRSSLTVEAINFVTLIKRNKGQLEQVGADINRQLELQTDQINSLATRIADLNAQIGQVQGVGQQPNDLRDQRDLLVDALSDLVHVSQAENPNGTINLFVGSRALVLANDALTLTTGVNGAGNTTVLWAADGAAAGLGNGKMQGLITVRDGLLRDQIDDLDTLAANLITQVNAVHATGFGLLDTSAIPPVRPFFTGTDATDIAIFNGIVDDPGNIAASDNPGEPGNNRKAMVIARMRDTMTMNGGTATFHTYYQSMVAELGTASRQAAHGVENQQALVTMLNQRKQAVAGVNLDEEATNLIKYQHAYQAAARVVTTVDDMLDRIINRMGRVGL
jgi:flagellar hook-associated protein 1 FlgK